jgi:hypothetical protein
VIIENTYNGNTNLVATNYATVATNLAYNQVIAPAGFVWLQIGGNFFVARNTIFNNYFEGVQVNAGPNSVVGNTYSNMINDGSCCALCVWGTGWLGATGHTSPDDSTCFIGNSVYGGRTGVEAVPNGDPNSVPYTVNCSGNTFTLYPALSEGLGWDNPGNMVDAELCQSASVCGNTLLAGDAAFYFWGTNGSALLLHNFLGHVNYRGIYYSDPTDSMHTAQVYGNTLGEGVSFHLQAPPTNGFGWFLSQNTYLNAASNSVPIFTDPLSLAIHTSN